MYSKGGDDMLVVYVHRNHTKMGRVGEESACARHAPK